MYIVRFGSCCPCGVYIALIPFSLTICEQSCMQLNHRALPQGEDCSGALQLLLGRMEPIRAKSACDRVYVPALVPQGWTSGLLLLNTNIWKYRMQFQLHLPVC